MKTGTVSCSELKKNGLVLRARYYLDRCANCGMSDKPQRHQNGMCGRYKRVFVPTGTHWKDANAR